MNQKNSITIAIDAMGGENSPAKVIKGCEIFLNHNTKKRRWVYYSNLEIPETFK